MDRLRPHAARHRPGDLPRHPPPARPAGRPGDLASRRRARHRADRASRLGTRPAALRADRDRSRAPAGAGRARAHRPSTSASSSSCARVPAGSSCSPTSPPIAVASVVSYVLHRAYTFRSDPFVRWVRMPGGLRRGRRGGRAGRRGGAAGVFAARGFDTTPALIAAKARRPRWPRRSSASCCTGPCSCSRCGRRLHERVPRRPRPGIAAGDGRDPRPRRSRSASAATVAAVRAALSEVAADGGLEIVVVDDGSTDGTADVALEAGADQVVVLPENRGKGAAVRAGVAAARGRTIAFTDADLAYSPDQLLRRLAEVEDGWDVAIGSRRHPDATRVRGAGALRDLGQPGGEPARDGGPAQPPPRHAVRAQGVPLRRGQAGVRPRAGRPLRLRHRDPPPGRAATAGPWSRSRCGSTTGERTTVRLARDTARLLRDLWRIRHWSATGAYELPDDGQPWRPSRPPA